MNKKIFKRLLIATSMIAPVVMVTPMLLTSCNDTNQSGGDQTQTDGNGITLVTFNSLLKEAKSFINPKNNVFWMNIDDSGPFYYNEEGKATEFGKFYEEILKNTSINFLSDKGYKVIDYSAEGLEEDKDVSIYKKIITKNDELLKLLDGLILSNFQIKNINQDISEEEKKNDLLGVEILGSKIDLASLIEKDQVEVNSYIKLVNKNFLDNGEASALHRTYNYEFVYSIKPKGAYYWKNVDPKDDKNKQAVEIRISDYINDILFIDNLDEFKLDDNTKIVDFTGSVADLTLGSIDIGSNITTVDLFVAEIKKNLGLEEQSKPNSRATTSITWSENTNLEKVFDLFLKADSNGDTKINGTKKGETTNNYPLKLNNIIINNLSEAFKKNRVKLSAEVTKDSTDQNKVVATIEIKLNDASSALGYFSWLLKNKSPSSYTDASIKFVFNWTFKQTN